MGKHAATAKKSKGGVYVAPSAFRKLQQLVSQGNLEITHILSPPRTMSTILEVALTEAVHGQIHEPFRKITKRNNIQRGFETILARVEELHQIHAGPIQIVVKDIAEFTPEQWRVWMPLVQNYVFIVREPHLQTRSLIKLSAIQALSPKNPFQIARTQLRGILSERSLGRFFLTTLQALEFVRSKLTADVQTGEEKIRNTLPYIENAILSFNRDTYRSLSHYLESVEEHLLESPHKNLIIVHGLGLKMIPAETLGRIADVLGWKDLPALGWSKSVGRKFYDQNPIGGIDKQGVINSPWHRRAATSDHIDRIDPIRDAPPPLAWFPALIGELICTECLPVYTKFLLHPAVVSLPSQDQLMAPLEGLVGGERLEDINPVVAYATAAALKVRAPDIHGQKKLDELQLSLRRRFAELHGKAFDIIDRTVAELGQCNDKLH